MQYIYVWNPLYVLQFIETLLFVYKIREIRTGQQLCHIDISLYFIILY